ncbi:hypothetical protein [Halomonas shantousis]
MFEIEKSQKAKANISSAIAQLTTPSEVANMPFYILDIDQPIIPSWRLAQWRCTQALSHPCAEGEGQ